MVPGTMELRQRGKVLDCIYGADEVMDLPRQQEVKAGMEKMGGPFGLLVITPKSLKAVDLNVVAFWFKELPRLQHLKAIAGITEARSVKYFGEAMNKSLAVVGASIAIKVFSDAEEGRAWLEDAVR
jgi:hypothetical protein